MHLLRENGREPTTLIMRHGLEEEHSEEGNYSRTVSRVEPQTVRINQTDGGDKKDRCKYKDFMGAKPPRLSRSPKPVEIRDWISEIEMVFESCNSSNKQKIVLTVRQLKTKVLSWWKLLADTMPHREALSMP